MIRIHPAPRRAVTLVEVLIVLAILGVLMALLLSAVQSARLAAARAACLSQIRQLGLAIQQYHATHQALPIGVVRPFNPSFPDMYGPRYDAYPMMTWLTRLLPYVEQNVLWQDTIAAYAQDPTVDLNPPHLGYTTAVKIFQCPSDPSVPMPGAPARAPTSYLGIAGTNQYRHDGLLYRDSRLRLADDTDGTSNTLLVGERPSVIRPGWILGTWYGGWGSGDFGATANTVLGVRESDVLRLMSAPAPCDDGPYSFGPGTIKDPCSAFHFWSLHPGGANFLFADGSARFLPYSAVSVMPALATRSGGETIGIE